MGTGTDIGTGRNSAPQSFAGVPEALNALAAAVTAAQQAGPLQPVTVVAPSCTPALDLARFLGRNDRSGSAAVSAVTLADLAEELAAVGGWLSGRAPLSPVLREGAVISVPADAPGQIAAGAYQPATARAREQQTRLLSCRVGGTEVVSRNHG